MSRRAAAMDRDLPEDIELKDSTARMQTGDDRAVLHDPNRRGPAGHAARNAATGDLLHRAVRVAQPQ